MTIYIAEELESLFLVKDYQWKIDNTLRYPNAEEIKQTIDKAVAELYDENEGTQIEVGRLIIKKHQEGFSVYVLVGDITND